METLHERSFAYDDENDRFGFINHNEKNNNNNNNNPSDPDVLSERLDKVRRAIQKATQEAWKQANGHSPSLSSLQKENASFLLGMDLFGSGGGGEADGSGGDPVGGVGVSGLEGTVRAKLDQVERDLKRIEKEGDGMNLPSVAGGHEGEEKAVAALSAEELADRIERYRRKVAFLTQASLARSCLEESTALTISASTGIATETDAPDNLVRSATTLLRALEEVDAAEKILRDDGGGGGGSPGDDPMPVEKRRELEVAHKILSSLRHQIRRHRVELVHKAGTVLDGSVELTPTSIAVKSSSQLTVAYEVLETLDDESTRKLTSARVNKIKPTALKEALRAFTAKLFREALKPILTKMLASSNSAWKVEESSDKRSKIIGVSTAKKIGTTHRIEWSTVDSGAGDSMDEVGTIQEEAGEPSQFVVINSLKNLFDIYSRILTFVRVKVFLERETLCSFVGKRLFGIPDAMPSIMNLSALGLKSELLGENDHGVLSEAIVKWLREQSLSEITSETNLDQAALLREELLECTIPFCREIEGLFHVTSNPTPRLIAFCNDFEKAVVNHRRCERLNEARDILLKTDYHNTKIVGVEENLNPDDLEGEALAVFKLSRCSISETADKLIALVRKTMDECVATIGLPLDSPLATLRPTLYKTAREMLSLFQCIIPANYGKEVANVPRTAAVLHNDSVFLAHHCLTLGIEYKEKFPQIEEDDTQGKLLKQTCIFVDMVPLFRELADTSMNDMLDLQKNQLAEIVGSRITYLGQSLHSEESVQEWSEAETGVAASIYHLRHLTQTWKPILANSVFLRSMGHLADVVFSLYLKEIFTNGKSISRSAKQFAGSLFRKAIVDVYGILFDGRLPGTDKRDDPSKYALEWGRFEAVGRFLDLNQLVQVEHNLTSGIFRNLESAELAKLITATYTDTPQRRNLLNSMASVV
eukprot:CAMPEP_0197173488 /NCGR_PEP_ID=MMETSP1423-20130617/399_1 /TAXON_ID=476441 /ORGANISM="Pseudo-nitzschia heimii, Strain UNC1101" /LENGTH=931 /DNA_ID=CAMNT_0042622311 /DNA_START=69 /DNA_END=2864 /DNA_ORIENTATION=-